MDAKLRYKQPKPYHKFISIAKEIEKQFRSLESEWRAQLQYINKRCSVHYFHLIWYIIAIELLQTSMLHLNQKKSQPFEDPYVFFVEVFLCANDL